MARHGPYQGIAGWFEDTVKPAHPNAAYSGAHNRPQPAAPLGFGGHDELRDSDQAGAADDLCASAKAVNIACSVHRIISFHTWQFAERGFSDALPWLAAQIQTPGSTGAGSPG